MMTLSGWLMLPKGPEAVLSGDKSALIMPEMRLTPGFVRIEADRIVEVVEGHFADQWDAGGPDCVICPGFVDTHLHLPQFDMIGAHGLPLLEWLQRMTFPSEQRWTDSQYAASMTQRVIDQCFSHGTTAICAYATAHADATRAALNVAAQRGIRGVIGHVLMDRHAPEPLLQDIRVQIDQTQRILDEFPPGRIVSAAITPRFAISCSEELLHSAGRLAAERSAVVQTHLAETIAECEWVESLFGGRSYTEVYEQAGLLTPRTLLGHGIYLTDEDCAKITGAGSIVAHCPTANSFLRSGTMNHSQHGCRGVFVSLGSDIGAGYERSLVRVGRAMIEAAASLGDAFPSAAHAWWQITQGNAERLGWHDTGQLTVGSRADCLVIRPDIPWQDCEVDALSMLMFAWDDRWLSQTIAGGRCVFSISDPSRFPSVVS